MRAAEGATVRISSESRTGRGIVWLAVVLLAALSIGAEQGFGPAAATTVAFNATADAQINSATPGRNYGADVKMAVCGAGTPVCSVDQAAEKRALVRFVASGLSGTVTKATLRYHATTAPVPALTVKLVTDNTWTESGITWNTGSALPTSGAGFTSPSGSARGYYEVDVTTSVTGNGTYSFAITNPTATTLRLATKESTNPVAPPQLVVTTTPSEDGDPVVVAAGDISTRTSTGGNKLTSDLVLSIDPDAVLTLGDNQYDNGALADFHAFYEPTWGRFRNITYPAPGHHDYYTDPSAAGYYTYFRPAASPSEPECTADCRGYYSFDIGEWHLVALNTNHNGCAYVACGPTSAQVAWLLNDLATTSKSCVLAYWSDPRWSSGTRHGSNPLYGAIWDALYDAEVDVVLNGHEHHYERFAKQNPMGAADPRGIRQFVVGTGGNGALYPFGTPIANSEVRNNTSRGVLQLTLHSASYDWEFKPIPGNTLTDSGSTPCNG